jgi:glycosyltransferase involved in cell wall biosynthesis
MSASVRFSVGIPTYNQADFLKATILSLLSQERPPDEIVISDHYSTDRTPEIVARFVAESDGPGKVPIRAVKPPQGTNLTGQYNFTLASQTGDWITLLSSDDLARPRYLKAMAKAAASRSDAVLVRAGWENIDPAENVVSREYMLSLPRVEQPPANLIAQRNGPKVSFAAFAIRRKAYLDSGPILQSVESLADWALFVQMAPFGSYVYVNELLSGYRVGHDGNKFRKRIGMWVRDEQRMFSEVFPLAADRAGLTSAEQRAWIEQGSRENFIRYLASASREFRTEERAELVSLFAPWAERTGFQKTLASFASGALVQEPIPFRQRLRRLARPAAQKVAWLVNRRR